MTVSFPERFNMADYFLYHNVEKGRENKTCLYFEDETFTYGDTARMSNRVGNALRELGVEIEDRVLIVLPDCPEFVWTWFGAARIGAVITMVNPLLPAEDYKYYLDYTRARVAVIHQSCWRFLLKLPRVRVTCARSWWLAGGRRWIRPAERSDVPGSTFNDTDVEARSATNARRRTRIATISRSGCSLPARPGIQKARSICSTICRTTPKSSRRRRLASAKTI